MNKRIVLAEDEPSIVESLRFLLGRAGYQFDIHGNGLAALKAIQADPPDMAILDVMLPEMDGFEILRNVRSNDETRHLPVLILTAKGQREDRERAIDGGADIFISKPFANADLMDAVANLAAQAEAAE